MPRKRLPQLVGCPFRRGVSGHGEMQDPAAVVSQHQEYVQHLKPNGWHREEVDRYHTFDVILQERPPGLRRWLAASRHIFANAGFADVDAEFEEFAVDARRSPKRVLAAHSPNQLSNLFGHRWTPGLTTTNLPRPEQPKPLAVPADHRFRFDDDKGGPPVLPKLAQLRPEKSIRSGLGSFHGPLQHTKLVPQGEDLELKDRSRTEHRQNRREQCGDHEGRGESPKEGQLPIDQPNRIFREPQISSPHAGHLKSSAAAVYFCNCYNTNGWEPEQF